MSMDMRKGPWLEEEDEQLVSFVSLFGERKWDFVATASGLRRSGKSCRLRWLNYLRPNLKRGQISEEEEQIIVQLHQLWGNKWAKIARRLPGRTDNEIKNYWRTHLRKKIEAQKGNKPMQELLCEKEEGNSEWKSNEETQIRNDSVSASELSSVTCLMNSPYESRLYDDWMSQLSSDSQYEINHEIHGKDDDYVNILDPMGSLWNIT